jgi:NTP pyrophosphatase (non-canonical NTP hydrolase)
MLKPNYTADQLDEMQRKVENTGAKLDDGEILALIEDTLGARRAVDTWSQLYERANVEHGNVERDLRRKVDASGKKLHTLKNERDTLEKRVALQRAEIAVLRDDRDTAEAVAERLVGADSHAASLRTYIEEHADEHAEAIRERDELRLVKKSYDYMRDSLTAAERELQVAREARHIVERERDEAKAAVEHALRRVVDGDLALTMNGYQYLAQRTAVYPGKGSSIGLAYAALGLNGEAGEVAEKVKKLLRDADGVLDDVRRAAIKKEIGDVLWYAAAVAAEIGVQLDEVARANVEKLAGRAERGTLQGSGDNR